jgi:hypothetical protein
MTSVRLLGSHTLHRDREVLTVTSNDVLAATSPHFVARQHAFDLVARGEAEWVDGPPPPELPPDPRLDKLQALADRPGTPGEAAAAQAAIDRITAGASQP